MCFLHTTPGRHPWPGEARSLHIDQTGAGDHYGPGHGSYWTVSTWTAAANVPTSF